MCRRTDNTGRVQAQSNAISSSLAQSHMTSVDVYVVSGLQQIFTLINLISDQLYPAVACSLT